MKKFLGILVLGLLFFVQIPFIANAAKSSSIMDGSYQLTWGKKNVFLKKKTSKVWPHILEFITIKDGKIKFELLDVIVTRKESNPFSTSKKYRKKVKLKVSKNKFVITGKLDLESIININENDFIYKINSVYKGLKLIKENMDYKNFP